ncbi:hypothetical protein J7399_07645 [Shimia sp. R9_1]|uniref:hypothetical protein n=1 Tax=Shimia sp. R9_1 TaxID=2821111 RepID=UPI001ADAB99D|nr:hypothetical protein [Shimia sp. R9_1]MBO9407295.1 hypothetical protein [Shimia sp. R9_1]
MQSPVFLDHLPDFEKIGGDKPARYRWQRNQSLLQLLLDSETIWTKRCACPACGEQSTNCKSFSKALLDFQRCTKCNSIFAQRVPTQEKLDQLRIELIEDGPPEKDREFEFISLLNWVSITEARIERSLDHVVDIRFSSQMAGWKETTERLSHNRTWDFIDLSPDTCDFTDLSAALSQSSPKAVLLPVELDRVANPEMLLNAIKKSCPKQTVLFIASSCADGLEYEILGADSPSFVPLDRLTVFSISGLQSLCNKVGLSVLECSTPGRLDAVILDTHFKSEENSNIPFWSGFFKDADNNRLRDLQILLQRSQKSGILRFVAET